MTQMVVFNNTINFNINATLQLPPLLDLLLINIRYMARRILKAKTAFESMLP